MHTRSVLLLVIVIVSGCNCDDAELGQVGDACEETSGCAAELTCANGVCAVRCDLGRASCGSVCCAAGEVCDGSLACVPDDACLGIVCGSNCCDASQTCQAGSCIDDCAPASVCGSACCTSAESCLDSQICCAAARTCAGDCCEADEICSGGFCQFDCGNGQVGCGAANQCCGGSQVCHQGLCIDPGPECVASGCATRPEEGACPDGQACDPALGLCLPETVNEACVYVPPVGVFDPVPLFTWGQRRARRCDTVDDCQTAEMCVANQCEVTWPHVTPAAGDMPEHYQATSIPMVVDLDGDCVPEIIFNTYDASNFTNNGVLRAIRGDTGAPVWTLSEPAYRTDSTANPAVGDLDGDGTAEVIISGPAKQLFAVSSTGAPMWTSDAYAGPESSGSASIANLDGMGDAEIVFGAAVFNSSGELVFEGTGSVGHAGQGPVSCVADLDGDERPELIGGGTIYEFAGDVAAGNFAGAPRFPNLVPDGYCGIADFDNDGAPEIAVVSVGVVYLLAGQTGELLARGSIPGGGQGGAPNIADFDGDGRPDIGTAGASNYVVMRYVDTATLAVLWQAPTEDDSSSRTGSSVFDFDGDGRSEVVYNDEEFLRIYPGIEPDCGLEPPGADCDGIMTDEEILFRDLNSSRTRTEYPVIADVDGDFKAEIVFATSNEAGFLDPNFLGDSGIEVWRDRLDNWVATRPVWNQHTYHVTNVGALGQIPTVESANWLVPEGAPYNSYRRNAQGGREVFCAPDLVVTALNVDASRCPALYVEATVQNLGCLGVGPGVPIAFYDGNGALLGVVMTRGPIAAGSGEVVVFTSEALGTNWEIGVQARADDEGDLLGLLNECNEDNNASVTVTARCRIDL